MVLQAAGAQAKEDGAMATNSARVVRKALGGGRWFPVGARTLEAQVKSFMDEATVPAVTGRIVGAISPHAGYQFSGPVAGYAFRALRDQAQAGVKPQTVVVLGFSHKGGFPGTALMDGDAIETPLGEAPLDKGSAAFLCRRCPRVAMQYAPHAGEHSAENQIPFVQAALPGVPLVIGLIGDHDSAGIAELVAGLAALAKERAILVVASTDLLHDPDYDAVSSTDKVTMRQIAAADHKGLAKRWSYDKQVCCGIGPVLAVLQFAETQGCRPGVELRYRNSGDDHPESRGTWVVGYGAAVFAAGK
jgi:AmmeMemoRadiSam system protein B